VRFTGRNVYLTGATGFIGGYVARQLLAEGANVTCLVRPRTDAKGLERAGATIVRGDITDVASLDLTGQHAVIHGAAWVGYGLPAKKLPLFRRTNVEGTQNVLDAATKAGVGKFIHVSSIAAIGATPGGNATEETQRGDFTNEYERTKTAAHGLVLQADISSALPMPGVVLGRGGPFDPLLSAMAHGRVPALPGDDATKGFVHVTDVAEGILLCALKGSGPYLLVDENVRTTELFVAALEEAGLAVPRRRIPTRLIVGAGSAVEGAYKLVGKTPPFSGELLHGLKVPMSYDSSKARKELGWRPDLVKRLAKDLRAFAG
jgi:dihydroflavonol-4-reductase